MSRSTLLLIGLALVLTGVPVGVARADDAPAWVRQAAAVPTPPFTVKDVPAVVLVDDMTTTVGDDGRTVTVAHFAVRVLLHEGRGYAVSADYYVPKTSKIRDMKGWLIRKSGEVKSYGKGQIVDATVSPDDVYDESRMQMISAGDDADTGDVFGCEYVIEDRPLLPQDTWSFQSRLPAVASRYVLVLPTGWQAESVTFNHAPVAPAVSGSTYSWELRNLPPIPPEPEGPPVTNLAPRLAVTYHRTGEPTAAGGFASWGEVSQWMTRLTSAQSAPDESIAAKTRELTGSSTTELDRIRAVGRYVQGVNYISIQTNLARGGGYTPHPATEVFAKRYGDCKDKANLMVSMLKTVGIPAYLVAIYSGDPTYVREEWATPEQFNHCIVAAKLSASADVASSIDHPSLGKLLIFDPTDTHTPVGDLPDHEQGSMALVIAGDAGGLVRMPETPSEANRLDRETEATLTPEGGITGRIRERMTGQEAVAERRVHGSLDRSDYEKRINRWIASGVNGAKIEKVDAADDRAANRFSLDVSFGADHYGQLMQGRLFVFKPAVVSRLESLSLSTDERTQPVVLDPEAFKESARITLPAGFVVDETPDPVSLDAPFGTYRVSYEVKDGVMHLERELVLRRATIPVAEYAKVRGFFEKIRAAEQAPVVLVRQ